MKKVAFLILLFLSVSLAQEFRVDPKQNNRVQFISSAPLEKIVGTSKAVDGYALLTQIEPPEGEFYFEADMATFDTGISLRNRHLRDNYLESRRFPYSSYRGRIVSAEAAEGGFNVKSRGVFDLHGVQKEMEIEGRAEPAGDGWRLSAAFTLLPADFNIERPQLMMLKVGESVLVEVELFIKPVKP